MGECLLHHPGSRQPAGRDRDREPRTLGDLPVLAEGAVEGAAGRRDRVRRRAGRHVEEGLLLDRVHADRRHGAVDEAHERPVLVLAYPADPAPPGADETPVGAHAAPDAAVRVRLRQDRRHGRGGRLHVDGS